MGTKARDLADLFETVSLGAPENAVGFVLWRVVHRYQREIDRALAAVDLTHLQFTILTLAAWLSRSGEAATQSELARFGEVHPMQVSLMLRALEEKGMIARLPSASNVRAKRVEVTPTGVTVLRRALPIAIEVQRRLFGEDGRPGGKLLTALLRLDGEMPEPAIAASDSGQPQKKSAKLKGGVMRLVFYCFDSVIENSPLRTRAGRPSTNFATASSP